MSYPHQAYRAITPLAPFDPLQRAIHLLKTESVPAIPVVDGSWFIGWVTAARLAQLLTAYDDIDDMVAEDAVEPAPVVVMPSSTPHEIHDLMHETGAVILPVVHPDGRYAGCVTQSDVLTTLAGHVPPPRIGGMATPLGVYLTNGAVHGGVGVTGLLLSGAVMALMLWVVQVALICGFLLLYKETHIPLLGDMLAALGLTGLAAPPTTSPLSEVMALVLTSGCVMACFLVLLRLFPRMAGYHAAEHQTVNAIEAGEPLTLEAVARMPRVHPRCGTNLWGLMMLTYLGVSILAMVLSSRIGQQHISLVVGLVVWFAIVVMASWKRLGAWMQQHLTTRKASQKELTSGIRAGQELLQHYAANPFPAQLPVQRIWNMGLAQVLIGAFLMESLLDLLKLPLDALVRSLVK